MCGSWLDGSTSSRGRTRWWRSRSQRSSDLARRSRGEDSGCWHGSACGEWAVGDCDGLLRGSSVGGSLCWSWHDKGSAGWADGGVALNGSGAVDNTSGCDGDTWGESCGLGECAWAL